MQHIKTISPPAWGELLKLPSIPLDFNLGFLESVPGIIRIGHTVTGMVCLALMAHFSAIQNPLTGAYLGIMCNSGGTYFLLVTYGCFVTSFIMIVSGVLSYFTASFLPKTAFEFGHHLISTILYSSSSMYYLVTLVIESDSFFEPGFQGKIAAAVLGVFNTFLYGASTYFSFKALKEMS